MPSLPAAVRAGQRKAGIDTLATNPTVVGGLSTTPNQVTEIRVNAPGGTAGVPAANVLASAPGGEPIAAVWDADALMAATGRLVVVMDINWLDTLVHPTRGPQAAPLVENLAFYLSRLAAVPEPVAAAPSFSSTNPEPEPSESDPPDTVGPTP